MEIDPAQRHAADLVGRLRQHYAPEQWVRDALPAIQAQPAARTLRSDYPAQAHTTPWLDHPAQDATTWTTPGRERFAPMPSLRRPLRRRQKLLWWQRGLLIALRLLLRLDRWWQRRQHRRQRQHRQRAHRR